MGSTVGILTPVFATAGVAFAWANFLPRHDWGVLLKYVLGACVGGGIVALCYKWVLPFLFHHGDVVLPFAVANFVTSAFWYAVCEKTLGLKAMQGFVSPSVTAWLPGAVTRFLAGPLGGLLPVGGIVVGVLTAATGVFLWPLAIKYCWSEESQLIYLGPEKDATFLLDIYLQGGLVVALPVGVAAGMGLQYLLAPFLTGTVAGGRHHWTRTSGALLVSVLAAGGLYFALSQPAIDDFYWMTRYDSETGAAYSWNTRSHIASPTAAMGVAAENRRAVRNAFHFLRHPVRYFFADRVEKENLVLGEPPKKPTQVLPDRLNDLADLDDYAATYQLMDYLLRLRYLQRLEEQGATDLSDRKEHVIQKCREAFGLDPAPLLEDLCSVIACSQALADVQRDGGTDEQIRYLEELRSRAKTHALHSSKLPSGRPIKFAFGADRAHRLLDVLLANNALFDKEHFAKLGVHIPAQHYVKRVEVARRKEQTDRAVWYVAGGGLLAVVAALAIFTSSKKN